MRHTLKATFKHRSKAQHALDELLASGYSRAGTAISDADGVGASIRHTMARLFTARHHVSSGAPAQARHLVTLTADTEADAGRAMGIIGRYAPVGIEDRLDEWEKDSAPRMRPDYPRGAEPGALQFRGREASHYFGTQNAESPPTGNTFEETMGSVSRWEPLDDEMPLAGRLAQLADRDRAGDGDTMTAYDYGKAMHDNDRNRNRSWDEVAADLRSGWEMRDTGASTWNESDAAIRRGWDAVSPEIDDDSYYRTHWNASYAPACLYGSEASRSERYRSHHWEGVDAQRKIERETRHAGQLSSWETFRDAVSHGWNRIRT
ncbi:hypothetical protein [Massilia aerilata]|uniref:Uncharacterized protein n=1 Tax=Massilia aerilata TaxID=453817 RepID=A0ABW0S2U8_9BURK